MIINNTTQIYKSLQCHEYKFNSDTYHEAVKLREEILRKPLGLKWSAHDFDAEETSFHLGAFLGNKLIGTLILRPRDENILQMRQVAIAQEYQSQGIGSILVQFAEQFAIEHGFTAMTAHARESALQFYLKLNYQVIGEKFIEVGIPHYEIVKKL
ncbi:MAG: GNAT family N-acetyltransferase [bacterium]